uniref:Tospovirus resistance protein A n=1 Tax=Solanum tuberosum TaxID=4113 RepID=M1AV52_SOLTU
MAENEIEEMLDHLRRIKNGGNLNWFEIFLIKELEMVLRVFRTFIKYHDVLLPDSLVELRKSAKLTGEILHRVLDRIPYKCKTNLNLERLESHLLEFFQGNTSLSYTYELNDFDLSKYMDCLEKILNDVLMMFVDKGRSCHSKKKLAIHRSIKELKIVQKKMRILKYIYATEINGYVDYEKLECLETRIQFMTNNVGQYCLAVLDYVAEGEVNEENDIFSKPPYLLSLIVFVELEMKKLPKVFSHHLHNLLMYLRNKKLENFPNNNSAQNIDVAIEFLLVFLDADVSNHVTNGNWLNEILLKVGARAGDILYVIQKLLPRSINKDDTSKISLCSIQILEKTKDLKEQVEMYYKSLKFTPS